MNNTRFIVGSLVVIVLCLAYRFISTRQHKEPELPVSDYYDLADSPELTAFVIADKTPKDTK